MDKKAKKIYTYLRLTTYILIPISLCSIVWAIAFAVYIPELAWLPIIWTIIILFSLVVMIISGGFTPIYISSDGIKYKCKNISWDNVKITAYPVLHTSFQYGYYLYIDDKYHMNCKDDQAQKKEIKKCPKVYLKQRTLEILLIYYKYNLLVLDVSGNCEVQPNSSKKINNMINSHNAKINTSTF